MMWCKAVCFKEYPTAQKILATDDVSQIKALGRSVLGYEEGYWKGIRQIVVYKDLFKGGQTWMPERYLNR